MGDNRDNSLDSRVQNVGFIPVENLIGRAELLFFSVNGDRASGSPGLGPGASATDACSTSSTSPRPAMERQLASSRRAELEAALGYAFRDPRHLEEALTHASSLQRPRGRRGARSYQRLEFLGDRVLGLTVAHLLIERFPDDAEGALTRRHSALVRKESLAEVARRWVSGRWLRVAPSEAAIGRRPAAHAAGRQLRGADRGHLPRRRAARRRAPSSTDYWAPLIESVQSAPRDAKMAAAGVGDGARLAPPTYRIVETSGPAHAMTFTVEVSLPDQAAVTAPAPPSAARRAPLPA